MKLRKLEMLLENISDFERPDPSLEQYKTPASIAGRLIHTAYMFGDIEGKVVYDLGCGTGILSAACCLLGASEVVGFDIDISALTRAHKSMSELCPECVFSFVHCDMSEISQLVASGMLKKANTVVMNPPFGAQKKGSDRPFLKSALSAGDVVYSIHNKGSFDFIEKFISPSVITDCFECDFPILKTFDFHTKDRIKIPVEIYRIETKII